MPAFTTKFKKVWAFRLYFDVFGNHFCRQSTSALLQNSKKKWAAFRLYFYAFWNHCGRQSTSAQQIVYMFFVISGTFDFLSKTAKHPYNDNTIGVFVAVLVSWFNNQ